MYGQPPMNMVPTAQPMMMAPNYNAPPNNPVMNYAPQYPPQYPP